MIRISAPIQNNKNNSSNDNQLNKNGWTSQNNENSSTIAKSVKTIEHRTNRTNIGCMERVSVPLKIIKTDNNHTNIRPNSEPKHQPPIDKRQIVEPQKAKSMDEHLKYVKENYNVPAEITSFKIFNKNDPIILNIGMQRDTETDGIRFNFEINSNALLRPCYILNYHYINRDIFLATISKTDANASISRTISSTKINDLQTSEIKFTVVDMYSDNNTIAQELIVDMTPIIGKRVAKPEKMGNNNIRHKQNDDSKGSLKISKNFRF